MIRQIRSLANDGAPGEQEPQKLLASLRKTSGFQYLMKTIFGSAAPSTASTSTATSSAR